MKLLLHSPDGATVAGLVGFLEAADHAVETTTDVEEATLFVQDGAIDAAVVDCAPAGRLDEGIAGLKARPPILALCDPVEGRNVLADLLDSGADDALLLPLNMNELLARLRALRRRATGALTPVIEVGRLSWDPASQTARVDGKYLHLTGKECRFFETLITRPGMTFSKEQLLSAAYNGRDEPELKIVDVFICKIRKKIAAATGGDACIETIWGRGYTIPRDTEDARVARMMMRPFGNSSPRSRLEGFSQIFEVPLHCLEHIGQKFSRSTKVIDCFFVEGAARCLELLQRVDKPLIASEHRKPPGQLRIFCGVGLNQSRDHPKQEIVLGAKNFYPPDSIVHASCSTYYACTGSVDGGALPRRTYSHLPLEVRLRLSESAPALPNGKECGSYRRASCQQRLPVVEPPPDRSVVCSRNKKQGSSDDHRGADDTARLAVQIRANLRSPRQRNPKPPNSHSSPNASSAAIGRIGEQP
jgi:two-component system, cell cycle response regulator CtrA